MMSFKEYNNKVGLTVKQMFTPKISDVYGATRVSSSKHRTGTTHIVLHTTANTAPAKNEALNINNNAGINSFHAVVDKDEVYETVRFKDVSHHAGNKGHNCSSLGFELVEKDTEAGYNNLIKYIGYVMAQLNLKPSHNTIKYHHDIVSTSCGSFYTKKGKDNILQDITHYYNIAKDGKAEVKPTPKPKPIPKPTPKPTPKPQSNKPSFDQIVKDVISGKYGNGDARVKAVNATGHSYSKVQAEVNRRLGAKPNKPTPKPKPNVISKGSKVRTTATKDIYGTKLDPYTVNAKRTFTVEQVGRNGNDNHILLKEIMTWVDRSSIKVI